MKNKTPIGNSPKSSKNPVKLREAFERIDTTLSDKGRRTVLNNYAIHIWANIFGSRQGQYPWKNATHGGEEDDSGLTKLQNGRVYSVHVLKSYPEGTFERKALKGGKTGYIQERYRKLYFSCKTNAEKIAKAQGKVI